MTKLLTTFFAIALITAIYGADNNSETSTFIETYDDGTDVGLWHCSVGVPRNVETSGGNPGFYLQQGGFSTSIPTWASISTRFQPGVPDPSKIDSIYTGEWTGLGVTSIAVDLNVIQVATWATDRAVTLELLQWMRLALTSITMRHIRYLTFLTHPSAGRHTPSQSMRIHRRSQRVGSLHAATGRLAPTRNGLRFFIASI